MKKAMMAALFLLLGSSLAQAQVGTAFTYQGRLSDGAGPANGTYDLQFKLFDALSAGAQVGTTLTRTGVTAAAGLFTVSLDFGAAAFVGNKRWLEIGVKLPAAASYTLLTPRQELTPSPNAVFSGAAGSVDWANIANIPASIADGDNDALGALSCSVGQVAKWNGAAWVCAADLNSGGTVTGVTASAPLTSSGGAAPDISLTGTVALSNGGTGASTAAGARVNLGAAASGTNADITALNGLTTPLSVTRGGTGSTTGAGGRVALGAAAGGANTDITALLGLTTALSVGQGGTGATSAVGARAALGAAAAGANADITSLSALGTPLSVAQGGTGSATQNFVDLGTTQTVGGVKTFTGANAFSTTQTMSTGNASAKGLILKGVAGQTANLLELQDSVSTVLSAFDPTGLFIGNISGTAANATTVGGLVCTNGQVPKWSGSVWTCGTDLSGGGSVTAVTATGPLSSTGGATPNLSLIGTVPIANGGTGSSTQNFVDLITSQSVGGSKTFTGANAFTTTQTVSTGNPSATGLIVRAVGSQTANLFELQDQFGAALSWFDPTGAFNGSTNGNTTRVGATPVSAVAPSIGQSLRFDGAAWAPSSVSVADLVGTVAIGQGGTGAVTASAARANLGGAARGANFDITALFGLTTPLSVTQGGTGSATQNFVDLGTAQTIGGAKAFSLPVVASAFDYAAPLSSSYMVSECAFVERSGLGVRCGIGNGAAPEVAGFSSFGLGAPVNLPHGAVITAVTFYVLDNDATLDLMVLFSAFSPATGGAGSPIAVSFTAGAIGTVQAIATTGLAVVVDNTAASYGVSVSTTPSPWPGAASNQNLRIYGARIDYTMARPAR